MAEQKSPSVGSILQHIQSGLAVIAGAVALFTATGFVIVNTALARYTDIFSYRVDAAQYLGASFGFFFLSGIPFILPVILGVFILFKIRKIYLRIIIAIFLLVSIFLISSLLRSVIYNEVFRQNIALLVIVISLWVGLGVAAIGVLYYSVKIIKFINAPVKLMPYLFGIYSLLALGYFYGSYFYIVIPRSIGGGQPARVYLLWENNAQELQTLLSEPDPALDGFAAVCVLAELSDGLLIYRPDTQDTIAIRDEDMVLAMYDAAQLQLDCSPPDRSQPAGEGTPEATPDPNVTITPTP